MPGAKKGGARRLIIASAISLVVHSTLLIYAVRPTPHLVGYREGAYVEAVISALPPSSVTQVSAASSVAGKNPPDRPPPQKPPVDLGTADDIASRSAEVQAFTSPPSFDAAVVSAVVANAATATPGEPCQLSQWLQQALDSDPQVQAALPAIPRPARSVANAIMIWNGEWVQPDSKAAWGYAILRSALVAGISAAPAACQELPVRGPELLTVTAEGETTIVAVGSGEWTWGELLAPASISGDQQLTRLSMPHVWRNRGEFANGQ